MAVGVHIVLYIVLAWVGEVIMIVGVAVAVAVVAIMAEVADNSMAIAEHVAIGRLGSDVARVIIGRYLGQKSA